jgi:hypothetical protein
MAKRRHEKRILDIQRTTTGIRSIYTLRQWLLVLRAEALRLQVQTITLLKPT